MYRDDIITEVWKNREAYAKRHGNSLSRMVADLQKRQQRPHASVVDRRQARKRPVGGAH
jgi:hypothetical protein